MANVEAGRLTNRDKQGGWMKLEEVARYLQNSCSKLYEFKKSAEITCFGSHRSLAVWTDVED